MAENNTNDIADGVNSLSIDDNQDETLILVGKSECWKNKSSKFFDAQMVVYEIECSCGCIYYGETDNKLRVALGDIASKIRNNSTNSVLVQHFRRTGDCNFKNALITIKNCEICPKKREQKKKDYIEQCSKSLNTQIPRQRDINPHN